MQFTTALTMFSAALFALLATLVGAVPTAVHAPLEARDVFVPPVTYPHAGTVWYRGQTHTVKW